MDQSLTAQQLYADLVAASKQQPIPEGAFAKGKFAEDCDISPKRAYSILKAKFDAGEMGRVLVDKEYWYYFKDTVE